MKTISTLLNQKEFSRQDLIQLLTAEGDDRQALFGKAKEIKKKLIGNTVYFRGLIEYSNICKKDCYYCGIRLGNTKVARYEVDKEEVLDAVRFAWEERYASIVIQAGEVTSPSFTTRISELLADIRTMTNGELGITLSLGEQPREVLQEWYDLGATRYLLRIEVSNPELYLKLHPNNRTHDYTKRINQLQTLRTIGYQVGTGVMIGLPFQKLDDLADDLLFFKNQGIDMIGMGPYVEHEDTPLYEYRDQLLSKKERFDLSLKMVAILRILCPDINIAATTAMQTLDPQGREKAVMVGSNVIMPNLTPVKYREGYQLYEDKPCMDEEASECMNCLEARLHMAGAEVGYGLKGDSLHFVRREAGK